MRQNFGKKMIGDKLYHTREEQTILVAKSLEEKNNNVKIVTTPTYITDGEEFIVVKNVSECMVTLNSETTSHIIIKALTKVSITPDRGAIDEDWDVVDIDRGACVEFYYIEGNWYIGSSDGIKMG